MHEKTNPVYQESVFDIIIAGAGCAGLSLLYAILNAPNLKNKKILVLDKSFEKSNDRTWCFWEKEPGIFESLVCKKWDAISIHKNNFFTSIPTYPFSYKMIQGLDFYNHIIDFAKQFTNVYWHEATITNIEKVELHAEIYWEGGMAKGNKVFSSILSLDELYSISRSNQTTPFLWQHFKGHLVEFENAVFDDKIARLMDFNVDQKGATGFMYVLPLNEKKALVEYTLFSKSILKKEVYALEITNYLKKYFANQPYHIIHEEMGAIPMTTQLMAKSEAPIFVIGTLGNAVKASTGYAFKFIQEQIHQIISQLENDGMVKTDIHNTRHQFYDAVLLHILFNDLMEGSEIFKRIFEKNKASTIFKFLSNTSTLWEDICIMRSLPTKIFLPAALKVLSRRN